MAELKITKKKKERKCFLNVDRLARYLSIPKSTIYNLTMKETIPHYHIGKLLRFRKDDIDAWLSEGGCNGKGNKG